MKELFAEPNILKNGTKGKKLILPAIKDIQLGEHREEWIKYSCLDSFNTYFLYKELEKKLKKMKWKNKKNMFELYKTIMKPFGEILSNIEIEGFQIAPKDKIEEIKKSAIFHRDKKNEEFQNWLKNLNMFENEDDCYKFNINSSLQKQYLFFGQSGKLFIDPNKNKTISAKIRREEIEDNPKLFQKESCFKVENTIGLIEENKKKALKYRNMRIQGLGLKCTEFTKTHFPSTSSASLVKLKEKVEDLILHENIKLDSDDPLVNYTKEQKKELVRGIETLLEVNNINKMLSTFITPLSEMTDKKGRIHSSLNLNTETGRLSSRKPNLQNQPALEKDIYKVRDAFIAKEGCTLIVADYGQLELRLLAELTDCKSMKDAFIKGGDFHSRTAMGMYDYIREAVEKGEVALESEDKDIPLLKDVYGAERRQAKALNFSIAYGKTKHGLAKDFKVTTDEAGEIVDRWYADRPEVLRWQKETKRKASKDLYVSTILGRRRELPRINSKTFGVKAHIERAAINTPIQGSAADVVTCAMIRIENDKTLKKQGWKMILQVHDEIILEGPKETSEEALAKVVELMKDPFNLEGVEENDKIKLDVELTVDAKSEDSWYKAK